MSSAAESSEPWTFAALEFAQDSSLEVDNRYNPFILILGAIVGRGQDRNVGFTDFLTMQVLHLVVARYKHPAISGAELDDFRVCHIPKRLAA